MDNESVHANESSGGECGRKEAPNACAATIETPNDGHNVNSTFANEFNAAQSLPEKIPEAKQASVDKGDTECSKSEMVDSPRTRFGSLLDPMLEAASIASRQAMQPQTARDENTIYVLPRSTGGQGPEDTHPRGHRRSQFEESSRGIVSTGASNSADHLNSNTRMKRQIYFRIGSVDDNRLSDSSETLKDYPPARPTSPSQRESPGHDRIGPGPGSSNLAQETRLPSIHTLLGKFYLV
jgi:hypothetical protein